MNAVHAVSSASARLSIIQFEPLLVLGAIEWVYAGVFVCTVPVSI